MKSISTNNRLNFGIYYRDSLKSVETILSNTTDITISNFSSLGLGIGLSFLGSWIVKRNRTSRLARSLGKLFGVDVNKFDKQYVLENLSDKQFFQNIGTKVLNVCKNGNIKDLSEMLEISENESWEIYLQIKDVILDAEILKMISKNTNVSDQNMTSLQDSKIIVSKIESELSNLKQEINNLRDKTISLSLKGSNLQLFTPFDEFGEAHSDCWVEGYFSDEDIVNGFSASREVTDDVLDSIHDEQSMGAVLSAPSGSGKTMILKQIMFEEIQNGSMVVFSKNSKISSPLLLDYLKETCKKNRILVIADDIQDKGNEAFFEAVNRFSSSDNLRFLFAFRPKELQNLIHSLSRDSIKEVTRAMKYLPEFPLEFDEYDARSFLEKALEVSNSPKVNSEKLDDISKKLFSKYPNPLMFSLGIKQEILKNNEPVTDILNADFAQKYGDEIDRNSKLRESAILCSCLNALGISVSWGLLDYCLIKKEHIDILTKKHFLLETPDGFTQIHEIWSLGFLNYIVENYCKKNLELFEKSYFMMKNLNSVLNYLSAEEVFSIINRFATLYHDKNFSLLSKFVLENLTIPENFSDDEKGHLYCFGLAQFFFEQDEHEKSLFYNKKAIQFDSTMIACHHNMGVSFSKTGKNNEALDAFDKSISLNKEFLISHFAKGTLLCEMGLIKEGSEVFAKAAKIPVENYDAVLVRELSNKLKRFNITLSQTSKIAKSDHSKLLNNQRIALAKLGKFKEAILCCDDILKINSQDIDVLFAKASYLGKLGQFKKSIPIYSEILEIQPENYDALCNKATALSEIEEMEESMSYFEKALTINPNDLEMVYNKGVVLQKLGDVSNAIVLFEQVINSKPDHYDSFYAKGVTLEMQKNYLDAIYYFEKTIKIKPDHFAALNNMAACYAELQLFDDSLTFINRSLDIEPLHYSTLANKAAILGHLGRLQESLDICNKLLRLAPKSLDVMQNKAISLRQLGQFDKALRVYAKILKINPDNVGVLYDKGALLIDLEKLSSAKKIFKKIIDLDDNHLGSLNCLGVISAKMKDYPKAVEYFEKVCNQTPDDFEAQMNLETALRHIE